MDKDYDFLRCIGLKVKPRKGDGLLFYTKFPNGTIDPVSVPSRDLHQHHAIITFLLTRFFPCNLKVESLCSKLYIHVHYCLWA